MLRLLLSRRHATPCQAALGRRDSPPGKRRGAPLRRTSKPRPSRPAEGAPTTRRPRPPAPDDGAAPSAEQGVAYDGAEEALALQALLAQLGPDGAQRFEHFLNMSAPAGAEAAAEQARLQEARRRLDATLLQRQTQRREAGGEEEGKEVAGGGGEDEAQRAVLTELFLTDLRERLGAEDCALMDRIFGARWEEWPGLGEAQAMRQAAQMDDADRQRLVGIFLKMKEQMGHLYDLQMVSRLDDAAAAAAAEAALAVKGEDTEEDEEDEEEDASASARGSGASADAGAAAGGARRGVAPPSSDPGEAFTPGVQERVASYVRHAQLAASGQQTYSPTISPHFMTLQRIYERLCELSDIEGAASAGEGAAAAAAALGPADMAAAFESLNEQMATLIEALDDIQDTPTRSSLLFIDTLSDAAAADAASAAASAAPSASYADAPSGAAGPAPPPPPSPRPAAEGGGETCVGVTPDSLYAIGRFMVAAQNLEAFRWWVAVYGAKHPDLNLERMLQSARLEGDDWFVRRDAREAAAAAYAAGSVDGRGGAALAPFVDSERIEAFASLDGPTLCFMAELEESDYSQDTFLKWSFHPTVGASLRTGDWGAKQLPEALQVLMTQAGVEAGWASGGAGSADDIRATWQDTQRKQ